MAVVRREGCLDLAHVAPTPGGRPEIRSLESFGIERDEADALGRLAQGRKLKNFRCATLLDESDYRLAQLDAPAVPEDERLQALRWRMKDVVDFPVDDAALAVADIPSEGARQATVFAVAAPRAAVGDCMKRFDRAGFKLQAIDIPEMALRNVAALFEEENRGLAFLLLNASDSLLVITYRGELFLSRRLDMRSEALAEQGDERGGQLRERLALELQRTLDTFDRQFSFISVSRLLVACDRDGAALAAALAENLYLPVQAMDLAQAADFHALPELRRHERQAQALLSIGAALRSAA